MSSIDPFDDDVFEHELPGLPADVAALSLVGPDEDQATTLARLLTAFIASFGAGAGAATEHALAALALSLTRYLHQPFPLRLTLVAPTGSGKSRLLNVLAHTLGIPGAVIPLVDIAENGWRGPQLGDVCRMLHPSLFHQQGLVAGLPVLRRVERPSILLLDEVDKCATVTESFRFEDTAAAARLGKQQSLLPLLDAESEVVVHYERGESFRWSLQRSVVICAGAFAMLPSDRDLTPADLVSVGLMPELVDRMGGIFRLPAPSGAVRAAVAQTALVELQAFAATLGVRVTGLEAFAQRFSAPDGTAPYVGLRGLRDHVAQRVMAALATAMINQQTRIDLAELREGA